MRISGIHIKHYAFCSPARGGKSLTTDNASIGAEDVADMNRLRKGNRGPKQENDKLNKAFHLLKGYNAPKVEKKSDICVG